LKKRSWCFGPVESSKTFTKRRRRSILIRVTDDVGGPFSRLGGEVGIPPGGFKAECGEPGHVVALAAAEIKEGVLGPEQGMIEEGLDWL